MVADSKLYLVLHAVVSSVAKNLSILLTLYFRSGSRAKNGSNVDRHSACISGTLVTHDPDTGTNL